MSEHPRKNLSAYDSRSTIVDIIDEFVSPHTRAVAETDRFAWQLAYDAMWRLKVILTEHRVKGNHAEILRAFAESVGDLSHDWAMQWDGGCTEYS